jgi:hypothetical protein
MENFRGAVLKSIKKGDLPELIKIIQENPGFINVVSSVLHIIFYVQYAYH